MPMPMKTITVSELKKETEKSWVVWLDRVDGTSLNVPKKTSSRFSDTVFVIPEWLYKKAAPFVV